MTDRRKEKREAQERREGKGYFGFFSRSRVKEKLEFLLVLGITALCMVATIVAMHGLFSLLGGL